MNILELAQRRCSIRTYLSDPVEDEKISYILEVARMAPSAVNYQPWYFLIIREEEGRKHIAQCYPREWIKPAPVFIAVCGDTKSSWKRQSDGKDHLDIDMGIVTEHICLAATELNLATCIICNFDSELFSRLFNLPGGIEPIALIPVAYPADENLFEQTPKKRKPMGAIIKQEKF